MYCILHLCREAWKPTLRTSFVSQQQLKVGEASLRPALNELQHRRGMYPKTNETSSALSSKDLSFRHTEEGAGHGKKFLFGMNWLRSYAQNSCFHFVIFRKKQRFVLRMGWFPYLVGSRQHKIQIKDLKGIGLSVSPSFFLMTGGNRFYYQNYFAYFFWQRPETLVVSVRMCFILSKSIYQLKTLLK